MTLRYQANHKQWDHTGHIGPEIEHSESQYPHTEISPASWLPVVRYDKKVEEYIVIAAGKVVALDRQGNAVPAGLALSFEAASGSTVLTYTANDVSEGTIDLTTGSSVTAATSYTQNEVTVALRARALIGAAEYARDFIGSPVGYAQYSYFQWCGGDGWNPALYRKHNHNLQHQVSFGTDKILRLPVVPAEETTETMGDGSISSSAITFGTSQWHNATGLAATTRYADDVSVGDNVVAYVFGKTPVAKITDNTPIADSGSALATKTEVGSIAAVAAGGSSYFYIDYEAGVLFLYEADGNAVPSDFTDGTTTIDYYTYEDAATGTESIAHVVGDVKPGDYLTFDSYSNFAVWSPDIGTCAGGASGAAYAADPDYGAGADATISAQLEAFVKESKTRVVAQVIGFWDFPRNSH
jgi:hypothetical protein